MQIWKASSTLYLSQAQAFKMEHVLLSRLVPRCSDPSIEVRQISMDCIQATLQLAQKCAGKLLDDTIV